MTRSKSWPAEWRNQRIVLYHGTDQSSAQRIVADGVDVYAGRREVDFGQGFYTTTSLKQVRDWALSRASKVGERPAVIRLAIDRLELRNLRSLVFIRSSMDSTDFWSFVTHCRKGKSLSPITAEDYDVVYGPVAAKWGQSNMEPFQISIRSASMGTGQASFCETPGVAT